MAQCFDVGSSSAPTNIAIVKYWGKDVARGGNTPINSSCSLTLDPEDLRAETVIVASPAFEADELYLNGKKADTTGESTHAKRLRLCLATMREKCRTLPPNSTARDVDELKRWKVRVASRNTFPTAAGLASSAAGYAALVVAAAQLYGIDESFPGELSTVARRGSGSACRSLHGGLVAWRKGGAAKQQEGDDAAAKKQEEEEEDSKAEQFFDEGYWPELRVIVLVANANEKETPSADGMQQSVATSPFLSYRAASVAEPRVEALRSAFERKDFDEFAELCARDSNSFHAVCLDTYPPIFYLDNTSRAVVKAVHAFNAFHGETRVTYTFDAGPNAVIFCKTPDTADTFAALAATLFLQENLCNRPDHLARCMQQRPPAPALVDACGGARHLGADVKMIYLTRVGRGAVSPLPNDAIAALIDLKTLEPMQLTTEKPKKKMPLSTKTLIAVGSVLLFSLVLTVTARRPG